MKKPTIASLQAQVAKLTADLSSVTANRDYWKNERYQINEKLNTADEEARKERKTLQSQFEAALNGQRNAESIYDQHRSAVLHYFMAASNPETAKDVDRLKDLQSIVCGLVPSRSVPQPKQPWEL